MYAFSKECGGRMGLAAEAHSTRRITRLIDSHEIIRALTRDTASDSNILTTSDSDGHGCAKSDVCRIHRRMLPHRGRQSAPTERAPFARFNSGSSSTVRD